MPVKMIFFNKELTTRKYAFGWIGIWIILFIVTWYSRPLLPYHETKMAAITWEMFSSENFLMPSLNGVYVDGVLPLVHWIQIAVWKLFGVSEFSLRLTASFFSLGTLLLTGWAAYQLWPEKRDIRANAPLILIGSLMWTVFATANIDQIYISFFSVLTINFLIRAWRFDQKWWWMVFSISLLLGFLAEGTVFALYILPIILLAPLWTKRYQQIYLYGALSIIVSFALFGLWGYVVVLNHPMIDFLGAIGVKSFINQLNDSLPFYVYLLNLIVILFPWVLWLRLYPLFKEAEKDEQLRFCCSWFVSLLIVAGLANSTSLLAFFSAYPALCLIIAAIYKQRASRKKDVALILITMILVGVLFCIIPIYYKYIGLPSWIGEISPLWGGGLILFSITFFVNARDTRLLTLSLMSVALTLAVNFGIIRQATNFYDLAPAGERIAWYQNKGIVVGHDGRYQGQFHFVGRLTQPLFTINEEDRDWFKRTFPKARIILYVEEITDSVKVSAEYWQPFRGKYLVIANIADVYHSD